MGLGRRTVLAGGVAALAVAGALLWPEPGLPDGVVALSADAALERVRNGSIWLVDIRRPDEWAVTGVAEDAIPLDMRRDDFLAALEEATRTAPERPVALICARGVRSRRMAGRLHAAGIPAVADVSEGMLGSGAGPGWIARGLPVTTVPG
ncbi:rhodanese-like domain-containing protein [Roseivivax isoporae]|uniref:rhodanese-like domain-containing protein n=1 Tax=Roseivivax isoporae TaxID=591206 RepID=UPI0004AF48FC|nr:rhodanese-like domain-containing protein [Roseivivax isoporae]